MEPLRALRCSVVLVGLVSTYLAAGTPPKAPADPVAADIATYRLSVPVLHKVEQAMKNFEAMLAANPNLGNALERLQFVDPKDGSLLAPDKAVAQIGSLPEFKKALASAGLTAREYIVFSFALLSAGLSEFAVSPTGKLPVEVPPVVAENARWLKANRAEYERFQKEMEKLSARYEKPVAPSAEEEEDEEPPEPESDPER